MKTYFILLLILFHILLISILFRLGIMGGCQSTENERVTLPDQGSKVADSVVALTLSVSRFSGRVAFDYACEREQSHGNVYAYNEIEDAKGLIQIRPIMIRDVNRIIKVRRVAGVKPYVHDDAYDPIKAREMFDLFQLHYCPDGTKEQQYAKWNEGPDG